MNELSHNPARVALVANTSWYAHNFRLPLLAALRAAGNEVIVVAPYDPYADKIRAAGYGYRDFPLDRVGINPMHEIPSIRALRQIFRDEAVDTVFSFTPKGNIYSALALSKLPQRLIMTITGLGRAYSSRPMLRPFVTILLRRALARADKVLFQNQDDFENFVASGAVPARKAERIAGSGVNLAHFSIDNARVADNAPCFLLVSRMLWAKGIGLYAEAATEVRKQVPNARFQLLGPLEPEGPDAVSADILRKWTNMGQVEYLGVTDDVRPFVREADCVVLPSLYREGVPRSLLEAAAMGKPLIATDMPGCRDVVDGLNGFLCRPGDVEDLAAKMIAFARTDASRRREMGAHGRAKIEHEFDESVVIRRYLDLV